MSDVRLERWHGFRLWYATLAGIALWLVHLTALSALVEASCARPVLAWAMHAVTVALGAGTLLAAAMSVSIVRAAGAVAERDPSLAGRLRFLGLFGLLTELAALVLIVWEGSYVVVLDACA